MDKRTIRHIHKAENSPMGDLITYRALPTRTIGYIDPFLFLNHHGPQVYAKNNRGLPFGPHPHRGMETVTFIVDGDILHKDNSGHQSVITSGGVQWMRAGRGVIHSEVSSPQFREQGGPLEILQLWVNLPAKDKMSLPSYLGLQQKQIPSLLLDDGRVMLNLISGNWFGKNGAFESGNGICLSSIMLDPGGRLSLEIVPERNIFFYVVRGLLMVNDRIVKMRDLVEFNNEGSTIVLQAEHQSMVLLGHALPLGEPVVSHGPFVMNTEKEIEEAYEDYRSGKFGAWEH